MVWNGDGTFTYLTQLSQTGLEPHDMGQDVGDADSDGDLVW